MLHIRQQRQPYMDFNMSGWVSLLKVTVVPTSGLDYFAHFTATTFMDINVKIKLRF